MRTLILLLSSCLCAFGQVNATWTFRDFQQNPQAVKRTTLTPLAPLGGYNGAFLTASPMPQTTSGAGSVTYSNLTAGYSYFLQIDTPYASTRITNGFPTGLTGNVNAYDYRGVLKGDVFYFAQPNTNASAIIGTAVTNTQTGVTLTFSLASGNAAGLTNVPPTLTNLNSAPWPGIYIKGSGNPAIDTPYGLKSFSGGLYVYTNVGYGVVFDVSGSGGLTGNDENVDLTNAAGQVIALVNDVFPGTGQWATNNPPNYDPIGAMTGGYTNAFKPTSFLSFGTNVYPLSPVVQSAWYVSPTGSDATGVKGRQDLPMQTLQGLLGVMTTNETAIFAPGQYGDTNLGATFHFPPGCKILGSGRNLTVIGYTNNFNDIYVSGTNVVLRDFTLWGSINTGSYPTDQDLVNAYFDGLDEFGSIDGVFFHYWDSPFTMRNCTFGSTYDALVLTQSGRAGYSNGVANAYNCTFRVGPKPGVPTPADGECIVLSGQRFNMYGGSLILESSNTANAVLISSRNGSSDQTNGLYRFHNVALRCVNTNGVAQIVNNQSTCKIQFSGMLVNSNSVADPNGTVDYGYTWMRVTNGATIKSVPGF